MDESEIPIDIHTNRLLDWLVSRRHVPRDWQTNIFKVREKINEAIKDMPVHNDIAKLLSGTYINYYHCQRIIEILKETESNTKNLFGQYGSKRMKDWLEIIKLYEKDNIYLGEAASLLLRNVNYEVPALRKQITRASHLENDYLKKEADYEKLANIYLNEYNATCKSLGIEGGKKIHEQLIKAAADFPSMNCKVAEDASRLLPVIEYYQKCIHSFLNTDKRALEILQYVAENGDKLVYEWKYKRPPTSVETAVTPGPCLETNGNEALSEDGGIDFGGNLEGGIAEFETNDDIDWGISTADEIVVFPDNVAVEKVGNNEKAAAADDTVARGEDARKILEHPITRHKVVNDVLELEAFLKLRLHEVTNQSDSLLLISLPDIVHMCDKKTIETMLNLVAGVKDNLTSSVSQHFLNITTNPRYVSQLAEKLTQKWNNHEKMLASKNFVRKRQAEVSKDGQDVVPKVKLVIEKSKELQDRIERDISTRYNGRPVNLMGGVNTL